MKCCNTVTMEEKTKHWISQVFRRVQWADWYFPMDKLAWVIQRSSPLAISERVRTMMHDLILPSCCCCLFLINYLLDWRRFIWCRVVSWWSCEFEQMNHGKWKNKPSPCIVHAIKSVSSSIITLLTWDGRINYWTLCKSNECKWDIRRRATTATTATSIIETQPFDMKL